MEIVPIDFYGDTILVSAPTETHEAGIVVRRVCENLGCDIGTQLAKLKKAAWASCWDSPTTAADGKSYRTTMIPLRRLPMWLAGIDADRVGAHVREKLVRYQLECADVLAMHFSKRIEAPAPTADLSTILDSRESTLMLMADALRRFDAERNLRLAAENKVDTLEVEVEAKSKALAIVTPKADIFDVFIDSNGLYLLMNAARALHQPPKLFIAALKEAKILGYENGELVARAQYTDAKDSRGVALGKGYFTHRPYTFTRTAGVADSRTQVFVTPLGLAWLGRALTSGRIDVRSNSARARKAVA